MHEIGGDTVELTSMEAVRAQIFRSCGFWNVIVVAQFYDQTHSMAAIHPTASGNEIICLNSGGSDNSPTVKISKDAFLKGYFVNVWIKTSWAPGPEGKHAVETETPVIDSEWRSMCPRSLRITL